MQRANNVAYSFIFQIGHTELKDPVLVELSDLGENEDKQNKKYGWWKMLLRT